MKIEGHVEFFTWTPYSTWEWIIHIGMQIYGEWQTFLFPSIESEFYYFSKEKIFDTYSEWF